MNALLAHYTRTNVLRGFIVYTAGDTIAAVLLGQFSLLRMAGFMLIGGVLYALEIPAYFAWIARKTEYISGVRVQVYRTLLAWGYFNPLWIARHLLFIKLLSLQWDAVSPQLLITGWWSFVGSIPISIAGNFVIQNKLPLEHRFLGSAVFSGLTAIYYALSAVWFR